MTDWNETIEGGETFYSSDLGVIHKSPTGQFVAIVPSTTRLGPFDTLAQAQQVVEQNIESLKQYLRNFNDHIMSLSKQVKGD